MSFKPVTPRNVHFKDKPCREFQRKKKLKLGFLGVKGFVDLLAMPFIQS